MLPHVKVPKTPHVKLAINKVFTFSKRKASPCAGLGNEASKDPRALGGLYIREPTDTGHFSSAQVKIQNNVREKDSSVKDVGSQKDSRRMAKDTRKTKPVERKDYLKDNFKSIMKMKNLSFQEG